jgi:hypothetical protein
MATILGRLFGLYAIYRAWAGRPIPGRRRPKPLRRGTNLIVSGTITAPKISANAVTPSMIVDSATTVTSLYFNGQRIA